METRLAVALPPPVSDKYKTSGIAHNGTVIEVCAPLDPPPPPAAALFAPIAPLPPLLPQPTSNIFAMLLPRGLTHVCHGTLLALVPKKVSTVAAP
jgi:hypothetical protein